MKRIRIATLRYLRPVGTKPTLGALEPPTQLNLYASLIKGQIHEYWSTERVRESHPYQAVP